MAIIEVEEQVTPPAPSRPRWRMPWGAAGLALLMVIGVMVNQYPSVASWVSQYYQSQVIDDVSRAQVSEPLPELHTENTRAREYNQKLVGGALVAANNRKPISESAHAGEYDYNSILNANGTGIMGRLRVPVINVDLPIYHGTDDLTLTKGIGHLEGTSLPVGGESQHSVLTAHRGLPEAELFDNLDKVEIGDTFVIEIFGEVLTYQVIKTQVVQPDETQSLLPTYGEDLVTLVTCTPLGINSHRILVTGERVTPTPIKDVAAAGQRPEIPGFPWWTLAIGGSWILAGIIIWRSGYPPKPRPRRVTR